MLASTTAIGIMLGPFSSTLRGAPEMSLVLIGVASYVLIVVWKKYFAMETEARKPFRFNIAWITAIGAIMILVSIWELMHS